MFSKYHEPAVRSNRRTSLFVYIVALLTVSACERVNGAAVDLSWSIRTFAGEHVEQCLDGRIDKIELQWRSVDAGEGSSPDDLVRFECENNRGVTRFVVGEGRQLFTIVPVCRDGAAPDPSTYNVPPAIARDLKEGEVATLDSLLIVVQRTCPPDRPEACTCP